MVSLKTRYNLLALLIIAALSVQSNYKCYSQDMDSLLNSLSSESLNLTTATFKSTRVINGHSVERMKAGQLDVRIHHRFGNVNQGGYDLFGLDQSTIFLGLEYGITDRLMAGIGRSSYEKTYSGFLKYGWLRQSNGFKNMPVTVTLLSGLDAYTIKWTETDRKNYDWNRFSYVFQVLVARKFSDKFSFQLSPTLIHRNLVPEAINPNDIYSLGFGGRYKLSNRISFNAEYYYAIRPKVPGTDKLPNSLSLGFDIETGGHVFQLFFTNSNLMYERGFITNTTGKWQNGDIRFGFNISRVFTLVDHCKK